MPDRDGSIRFPFDANVTGQADTLRFSEARGKHILLWFATHDALNCECISCGRFAGVVLGLALFTERIKAWVLSAYSPGVGCFGAFQTMPKVHLLKLGNNNYGCYLLNSNGAGGGAYYSDLFVFAGLSGHFKQVMYVQGVSRYNTPSSNWSISLKNAGKAAKQRFEPIQLELNGTFKRWTPDPDYDSTDAPVGLERYTATTDSFDFSISYRYVFSNGRYHKVSSKATVKH